MRGGRDPDTVAAIAGGLLGAAYGASAVPAQWRRILHGWPGINARGLVELASSILRGKGDDFDRSYPAAPGSAALAQHPYDDHVWLGGIGALRALPDGVDAVVSLCRVGDDDLPKKAELVEVRLIDKSATEQNRNLGFVLHDTVSVIERLRREGRTVLVHCVQAQSRTPTIAALYGMRRNGTSADTALAAIQAVLPSAHPNDHFRAALRAAQR